MTLSWPHNQWRPRMFLVRFVVKPGGNLDEYQKQKKAFITFWCDFCRNFRWWPIETKEIWVGFYKISLLVHIQTCGPRSNMLGQFCFRRTLIDFRAFSGLFLASNHFSGSGQVWAYAFGSGLYKSARLQLSSTTSIYVICILIKITSLQLSRVVSFLIVVFLYVCSFAMFSTLPNYCFSCFTRICQV